MKKKIKYKDLGWAAFSLGIAYLLHLISINYVIGSGLKFIALAACIINIATAFNINIPYITDKKKLPKNYNIYAFTTVIILYLIYAFFK